MKPHDQPHGLCSIDPVTIALTTTALMAGMAANSVMSSQAQEGGTPAPTTAAAVTPTPAPTQAAAAPPAQQPVGASGISGGQKAGGSTAGTPSFVGAAAMPSAVGYGSKTLLGQ